MKNHHTHRIMMACAMLALCTFALGASLADEVRAHYDKFRSAVERHDLGAVRPMLDSGFSLNLPDGRVLSRERYLAAVGEREDISEGVAKHKFTLSRVREQGGYVKAEVVLTLDSKFRDGDLAVHSLRSEERKSITWRRTKSGLVLVSIFANDVRTVVDGKQVSRLVRR